MNYQQTLDYLYSQLPMFTRDGPSAFKKDLTNTLALCERLDNPQRKFKSVHIGGTNGKGSTSHMLAAVLQVAGYKTGLYTSPHLRDFRERIRINGAMINEQYVVDFVALHKADFARPLHRQFEARGRLLFGYPHFALEGAGHAGHGHLHLHAVLVRAGPFERFAAGHGPREHLRVLHHGVGTLPRNGQRRRSGNLHAVLASAVAMARPAWTTAR